MSATPSTNVALITGASSGIGRVLAQLHAAKGGDLVLVARSEDKLQALAEELHAAHGTTSLVLAHDLSQLDAPQAIFDAVQAAGVEVEILINNAGFGGRGLFHERDWALDQSMIQVNILALTALTRLFLPAMVARNHGRILNISSTASLMPGPLQAVYYASKAYVTSFSNALAEELHDSAVTVTAVLPGATDTGFAATSDMDKTQLFDNPFSPEVVAQDAYAGMLRGELNVITAVTGTQRALFSVMGFLPLSLKLKMIRQMQEV